VIVLLVTVFFSPSSTQQQYIVYVILALAAALVGAWIPGKVSVTVRGITATGAIALFVIVLIFRPKDDRQSPNLHEGTIRESTGHPMSLTDFMADFGTSNNMTIVFRHCSAEQQKARVPKGHFEGNNAKDFLENVRDRIKDLTYTVNVIKEDVRYEIICR
jgi:hypothetical protein